MDPPEQMVTVLSVQGAVAPFKDPEEASADSTFVDESEEQVEEEAHPDGDDPEVQPDGYWMSRTRYVQFAKWAESESSREDENQPVGRAKVVDQVQELADALPADREKKVGEGPEKKIGQDSELADALPADNDQEVARELAETAAALEVGAMDSGDLRRQQLTMRSSEQQKREEAKEGKKKGERMPKNGRGQTQRKAKEASGGRQES